MTLRIIARIAPIFSYVALFLAVTKGEPKSLIFAVIGILHAMAYFAMPLFLSREDRTYNILFFAILSLSSGLAFFINSWALLLWMCIFVGIGFSQGLGNINRIQLLTSLAQISLCLSLIFFIQVPELLIKYDQMQAFEINVDHITAILVIWIACYLVSLTQPGWPTTDIIVSVFFSFLTLILICAVLILTIFSEGKVYFLILQYALLVSTLVVGISLFLWRPVFSGGLSVAFYRHILSVNVPFEKWMSEITQLALNNHEASNFWIDAMSGLVHHAKLKGIRWTNRHGQVQTVGKESKNFTSLIVSDITLHLYSTRQIQPSRLLNIWLLAYMANEFLKSLERDQRLAVETTMQSVHEIGARTTHDIKNLLHAINLLCTSDHKENKDTKQSQILLLANKVEQCLEQLNTQRLPQKEMGMKDARIWWEDSKLRNASPRVTFTSFYSDAELDFDVPADLFDRTLENLVHNALRKNNPKQEVKVEIKFGEGPSLSVRDDGEPIPVDVTESLFKAPLPSTIGMGIGLYQIALNAERLGYDIFVEANEPGDVVFKLEKKPELISLGET